MLKKALRVVVVIGLFGIALGAIDTWWRAPAPETIRDRDQVQRSELELVAPALGAPSAGPTADAGFDRTVAIGETALLDGGGSTAPKRKELSFAWSIVSKPAASLAVLDDPASLQPSFQIDEPGDYVIELVVTEGSKDSTPDTVVISTVNSAPVAEAGADQAITAGQTVRLDGSGSSDFDGDGLSYAWNLVTRPAGSAAVLDDLNAVRPSFIADLPGAYLAELVVGDGASSSPADTVALSTDNVPPVADAGPDRTVPVGTTIELDGVRAGDAEGDALAFDWALVVRPPASSTSPVNPNEDRPSLLIDVPGLYVVQLIVDDDSVESVPDTFTISVADSAPVADAGLDQTVSAGEFVTLDGGASGDIDGDLLSFRWALTATPAGSAASLDNPFEIRPHFTADLPGTYVAQLVVEDPTRPSLPDTVVVTTGNSAPVAEAGADQTAVPGATVHLDGSGSFDADSDALGFRWSMTRVPSNSSAALDDPASLTPSFVADKAGLYLVQLIVEDGLRTSAPDGLAVSTFNSRPVADAGPEQQVVRGVVVQLDGSGSSDADSDPLSHGWALIAKPTGSAAALSDPALVNPAFVPDSVGTYVAQLIVTDGALESAPDTAVIETVNQPPVANAGLDQTVTAGDTVELDGSASFDPDLDPIGFAWTLVDLPEGSAAALSNSSAVDPTFVADLAGDYVVELTVSDGLAASLADQVTVTAEPGGNQAPVLGAVGNQVVALGSSLSLTLNATDPDGDPVSFTASPLPLPAGASLDSMTGAFTFTPDEIQVGDIALTFIASDGLATDSESITITVTGAPPAGVTALSGRLLDASDFSIGLETPIVGATISILDSALVTTTGTAGSFLLSGIPDGTQVLDIDAATANPAPDGSDYASFREEVQLIENVANVIDHPFFLPRIEAISLTTVDPNVTTIVSNPRIQTTLEVAPISARNPDGTLFTGQLSISEVPLALAPAPLPEGIEPGLLVTIQPVGVIFDPPAQISFPNVDQLPASASGKIDIWSLDPELGGFTIVGTMGVSADGTQLDTASGGIRATDWHFPVPQQPGANGNDDTNMDKCCEPETGSRTALLTGNLQVTHELAGTRSFGQSRSLRFSYNSTSADPRPVVFSDTRISAGTLIPLSLSARVSVGGVDQGQTVFMDASSLVFGQIHDIRQALQVDASSLDTGRHEYQLTATSNYPASKLSNTTVGTMLVNNQIDSPFGAGWTLDGVDKVQVRGNSTVVAKGDGGTLEFQLRGVTDFSQAPVNVALPFGSSDISVIDDFNGDQILDIAISHGEFDFDNNTSKSNFSVFLGDGENGFPTVRNVQVFPATGMHSLGKLVTGDFDNDGLRDIISTVSFFEDDVFNSPAPDLVTLHTGAGGGFFRPPVEVAQIAGPQFIGSPTVADFDGDGNEDVVVLSRMLNQGAVSTTNLLLLFGDGNGGFPAARRLEITGIAASSPKAPSTGDFNDDGFPDIAFTDTSGNGLVFVLLNDGTGGFAAPLTSATGPISTSDTDSADMDGDGNLDIVTVSQISQIVSVLFGDGSGQFPSIATIATQIRPFRVKIGDFNADGNPDIVAAGLSASVSGQGELSLILADGLGGFELPSDVFFWQSSGFVTAIHDMQVADFNRDGLLDVSQITGNFKQVTGLNDSLAILSGPTATLQATGESPSGDFSALVRNDDGTFTQKLTKGTRIEFDAEGRQTASVDRNGNATSYAYDPAGLLTSVTDPAGLVTTLAYTGGRLSTVTDSANRVTTFEHDVDGNLTKIVDPDQSERRFAYDPHHRMSSQTSKRNFTTGYDYGFHGRVVQTNLPDSSTRKITPARTVGLIDTSTGLGTEGNPAPLVLLADVAATLTDGNDNTTTFALDSLGTVTQRSDALSRVFMTGRDENGNIARRVAANGRIDEMTYDGRGNLLTLTDAVGDPLERLTTFTYEPEFNQVTSITDPRGNPASFGYDANGNLTTITDAALTQTLMVYGDVDCPGLVTSITRAVGLPEETTSTLAYDPVTCNLVTATDDLGNPTSMAYDAAGNVISAIDALLRETRFEHDELNRMTKSIDATNSDPAPACGTAGVTCFAFDAGGNLTDLTDANGNVTDFAYDTRERVTDRTDPLLNAEILSYDGQGNLLFATDRKGQTIELRYDLANRLVKMIVQPGQPEEVVRDIGYDPVDNVTSIVDPDSSLGFTYDPLNRATGASTAGSPFQPAVALTATHDANGNRLSLDDPVGQSAFVYDVLNRLTDIATPSLPAQPILYSYDALSRRTGVSLPNGVDTSVTFDTADRLTDISHVQGGAATVSSFGYGHDTVNNRTSLTQTRSAVTVQTALSYVYDDLDRLTQATHPEVAAPDETFGYDPVGNRLNRDGQVVDSVFDSANRLIEDADFTYAYDLNGNLETKTAKAGGAVTDYTWDAENRLARIDLPGGGFAEYLYDGLGRRIQKDANGALTRYVYDGSAILLEYDGLNVLLARTTHGPGTDDPAMVERDIDASGTFEASERFFYQTDGLGSVTELTDSVGAVARSLVYDSYGNIAQDTGGVAQPFAFTGRELDTESGLYFYRARYYDAATGRFLSQDPVGFGAGDTNLYRYVFNNPIGLTDPSGQICLSPTEIAVASSAFGGAVSGAVLAAPGGPVAVAVAAIAGGLGGAAVGSLAGGAAAGALGGAVGGVAGGGAPGALGGAIGGAVDSAVSEGSGGGFVGGFLGGFAGGAVGGAISRGVIGGLAAAQVGGTVGAVAGAAAGVSTALASEILNGINDCPCE